MNVEHMMKLELAGETEVVGENALQCHFVHKFCGKLICFNLDGVGWGQNFVSAGAAFELSQPCMYICIIGTLTKYERTKIHRLLAPLWNDT
jgi:hypothetical protein